MEPADRKKRATYQDVLDAPEHVVAEILDGELVLSPRPTLARMAVTSALHYTLYGPFSGGGGGPGGWHIVFEPEVHLGEDVVVPDIAGWRRERLGLMPDAGYTEIAPDWVCEVLSPSTEKRDRTQKLRIYMRAGVGHVWLLNPGLRTLEVYAADEGRWVLVATLQDSERGRLPPFEAIELDLLSLWRDIPLGACEEPAEYSVGPS